MAMVVDELDMQTGGAFEWSVRGYHRGQVDRYIAELEVRLATFEAQLAAARYREDQLTERLRQARSECACGEQPPQSHVVGARIEHVLQLADQEAAQIRELAERELAKSRKLAEAMLNEARQHAEEALRELQQALAAQRNEEARTEAMRRAKWEAHRQAQQRAAVEALHATRAVGVQGIAVTRQLLDGVAGQHATLAAEVQRAEQALTALMGDGTGSSSITRTG